MPAPGQVLPDGRPNHSGFMDPRQVQGQKRAATDVAERIAGRRNPVDLVFAGNMRQERVVEDEAAVGPDVGQDEQDRSQDPIAFDR